MLLASILVAIDIRADLSELKPAEQMDDQGAVPVGWPELAGQQPLTTVSAAHRDGARRVRMIGYMMDIWGPPHEGASMDAFVLLPEAGQLLHPAHRIPNQMVEVWPGHPAVFHYRELVWVSGILNRTVGSTGGSPGNERAAYALSNADVTPASPHDIAKWFRP